MSNSAMSIPSITTFWPDVAQNLTQVKWKHAVNSQALLDAALKSDVHMIEADVGLNENKKPIMVHPPATTSDLSLEEFITKVAKQKDNKKGIKLDFKSTEAFNKSFEILTNHTTNMIFPVWLNADILKGPEGEAAQVKAEDFLKSAKTLLPGSVLSLGWTTKSGPIVTNSTGNYTKVNIDEMLKTVEANVNQDRPVTYALRAYYVVQTENEILMKLLKNEKSTLTIWSAEKDDVDPMKLTQKIKELGLAKVFVDVPADLHEKMHLNGSGTMKMSTLSVLGSILFCFLASSVLSK